MFLGVAAVVDLLFDEAAHVAVDVAGGDVGENVQPLETGCEFEHAQSSLDVALDGLVEPSVEVDAGGAVDHHVAGLNQFLPDLGTEAELVFVQVALSEWMKEYMGCTLCWMNY